MGNVLEQKERSWDVMGTAIRAAAKETLGVTWEKAGKKEETWLRNEELHETMTRKREEKKEGELSRCDETITSDKKGGCKDKEFVIRGPL